MKVEVGIVKVEVGIVKVDVGIVKVEVCIVKVDVGIVKVDVGIVKVEVGIVKLEVVPRRTAQKPPSPDTHRTPKLAPKPAGELALSPCRSPDTPCRTPPKGPPRREGEGRSCHESPRVVKSLKSC